MNINSKFEIRSSKQIQNSNISNSKQYDLEARTLEFSRKVIRLCRSLPKDYISVRLGDQCLRAGTSVGANYREANETDSKRDFRNRIRISKKEAKETIYWLRLMRVSNPDLESLLDDLLNEAKELMKILGAIYEKTK
ncbi:MAG: four helix bundle protein [bacterium]|nr:four helix bundle protein [bacterium]